MNPKGSSSITATTPEPLSLQVLCLVSCLGDTHNHHYASLASARDPLSKLPTLASRFQYLGEHKILHRLSRRLLTWMDR